jgi:hypothetical protein
MARLKTYGALRPLSIPLLCLLLGAAACTKKQDPEPATPALEGRWNLLRTVESGYAPNGTRTSLTETTYSLGERYADVAAQHWAFTTVGTTGTHTVVSGYTRQADTLNMEFRITSPTYILRHKNVIVELTPTTLHLQATEAGAGRTVFDDYYAR